MDQHYISLPAGHYRMVIMNKTFSEFAEAGYINFEHPENFWLFMARAVSPWKQQYGLALSQRREQASPLDSTFVFMAPPERLASVTDSFDITEGMIREQMHFVNWEKHYDVDNMSHDTVYVIRYEEPEPLTTTVYTQIRVAGIDNARACDAALWGFADGCSMTDVWRTKTTGTLLLTDWKGLPTRADNGDGWIYSQTTTFGLPHGMEQPRHGRESRGKEGKAEGRKGKERGGRGRKEEQWEAEGRMPWRGCWGVPQFCCGKEGGERLAKRRRAAGKEKASGWKKGPRKNFLKKRGTGGAFMSAFPYLCLPVSIERKEEYHGHHLSPKKRQDTVDEATDERPGLHDALHLHDHHRHRGTEGTAGARGGTPGQDV